jgi:large subunit ribosomal protein L5
MYDFKYHFKNIVKHDLLLKYANKHLYNVPKLKKVVLNFSTKDISSVMSLLKIINVLELISLNVSVVTCSKTSNIRLKFREGTIVGCKITLRNNSMHSFLFRLILLILPKFRQFEGLKSVETKTQSNSFSFSIQNVFIFSNFNNHHSFFVGLPKLYVNIVSNCGSEIEIKSLLTSYKLPISYECEK